MENGVPLPETRREFFFRISADRPFSPRAPGRWAEMRAELAAAPSMMEQWDEIAPLVSAGPLVAHNAGTERTILTRNAPLTRFGPWVDTLTLARAVYPQMPSHALGDLAEAFGLVPAVDAICPGRTWHDALYDACAGAALACHFMKLVDLKGFWK